MKIQTKILFSLNLLLIATLFCVVNADALRLSTQDVAGGTVGSALDGAVYIDISPSNFFGTKTTDVDAYNPVGPVSHNLPLPPVPTSTRLAGYSDAGLEDMGLKTYTNRADSNVVLNSYFGNNFTVGAGETGLTFGDSTTLEVKIRLDGTTNTNADRNSEANSLATLNSGFTLWNPSQADVDFDPYLLGFSADVWNQKQTTGDGSLQHNDTWQWRVTDGLTYRTRNNILESDSGGSSYFLESNEQVSCLTTPAHTSCSSVSFDTGYLTFYVDTYVGAELATHGWMRAQNSLAGSGLAWTDFLDTFGATITAADGIELNFAVNPSAVGPAPVPEPSTILLLGGGLAGLAFYARRRRKE